MVHHVALACRDLGETHRFYEDLLGFPLVHAEMEADDKGGWYKHAFYDVGQGSCIAFFELHQLGEPDDLRTEISTGLGLPSWVNHVAFKVTEGHVAEVRRRFEAAGVKEDMELDHGWCRSLYVTDPNGILVELTVDTPGFKSDPAAALAVLNASAPDRVHA